MVVSAAISRRSLRNDDLLSISEAADALDVSVTTLRRWSEAERIQSERTAGGHRRFHLAEVRRVLSDRQGSVPSRIRPLEPPSKPMVGFARLLDEQGDRLATAAAKRLYGGGRPGWFSSAAARDHLRDWVSATAQGVRSGRYEEAIAAWQRLTRQADLEQASVLECHSFLEFFGIAAGRELKELAESEIGDCRRLIASLRQLLLDHASVVAPSEDSEADGGQPREARVSSEAAAAAWPGAALDSTLAEIASLGDIESATIFLAERGGSELRLAATVNVAESGGDPNGDGDRLTGLAVGADDPVRQVASEGRARLIVGAGAAVANRGAAGGPMTAAPMFCDGRLIGVLCLSIQGSRRVDEHDLLLLTTVGRGIAIALELPDCAEGRVDLENAMSAFRAAWRRAS
ncbi:MAG: putative resolvase [Solirubrobacterales bacterium]|nr:putative resolvase [Solirubrobacterales bacterium]